MLDFEVQREGGRGLLQGWFSIRSHKNLRIDISTFFYLPYPMNVFGSQGCQYVFADPPQRKVFQNLQTLIRLYLFRTCFPQG